MGRLAELNHPSMFLFKAQAQRAPSLASRGPVNHDRPMTALKRANGSFGCRAGVQESMLHLI